MSFIFIEDCFLSLEVRKERKIVFKYLEDQKTTLSQKRKREKKKEEKKKPDQ